MFSFIQTENKETVALNEKIHVLDLISIKKSIPQQQKQVFISSAYGTFSKLDYILGHKSQQT